MKLYTEEQVTEAISIADSNDSANPDMILAKLKSIELPSDEEIGEKIINIVDILEHRKLVYAGALWMLEQIKQQGK